MSFAGHIFDMIRRNKENSEALKRLRRRPSDHPTHLRTSMPNVTAKQFKKDTQDAKQHRQEEQHTMAHLKLKIAGILTAAIVLLLLMYQLFK